MLFPRLKWNVIWTVVVALLFNIRQTTTERVQVDDDDGYVALLWLTNGWFEVEATFIILCSSWQD